MIVMVNGRTTEWTSNTASVNPALNEFTPALAETSHRESTCNVNRSISEIRKQQVIKAMKALVLAFAKEANVRN